MAAKNLEEAIRKAMTTGKASDFPVNMKNEIRDLLAYALMRILGEKITEDDTILLYKIYKTMIGG